MLVKCTLYSVLQFFRNTFNVYAYEEYDAEFLRNTITVSIGEGHDALRAIILTQHFQCFK